MQLHQGAVRRRSSSESHQGVAVWREPFERECLASRPSLASGVREQVIHATHVPYHGGKMFVKRTRVRSGNRVLTYLQLMESYRDGKRIRQRLIRSLGREDLIDAQEIDGLLRGLAPYGTVQPDSDTKLEDALLLPGWEYGSLYALNHVWDELDLPDILAELTAGRRASFSLPDVVRIIVFGMVMEPENEHLLRTAWLSRVHDPAVESIDVEHARHALEFLSEFGTEIEARLARVLTERLAVDATLVLYNTTVTTFEGAGEDGSPGLPGEHAGGGTRPQVKLALLTSREGFPLGHWLFPGDQPGLRQMVRATNAFRERLALGPLVIVADHERIDVAEDPADDPDSHWINTTATRLPAEDIMPASRGLRRIENVFGTIKLPKELRSRASLASVAGHLQSCVLAYLLTGIIEHRLARAGHHLDAQKAMTELARIRRVPLRGATRTIMKITSPNLEQTSILSAIGVTIPKERDAR